MQDAKCRHRSRSSSRPTARTSLGRPSAAHSTAGVSASARGLLSAASAMFKRAPGSHTQLQKSVGSAGSVCQSIAGKEEIVYAKAAARLHLLSCQHPAQYHQRTNSQAPPPRDNTTRNAPVRVTDGSLLQYARRRHGKAHAQLGDRRRPERLGVAARDALQQAPVRGGVAGALRGPCKVALLVLCRVEGVSVLLIKVGAP